MKGLALICWLKNSADPIGELLTCFLCSHLYPACTIPLNDQQNQNTMSLKNNLPTLSATAICEMLEVDEKMKKYKVGHKGFRDRQNDGKLMATQSVDRNIVMMLTQLVTGPTMRRI